MTDRLRIVVTGLIAQHPRLGGVAWDYVQYPLGLADLGHDVYYLEDSGEWPYSSTETPAGSWIAHDPTPNVRHLAKVMERFGLGDRWMYRFPIGDRWYGLSDRRRAEVLASADLLVNVSGTLEHPERYRHRPAPRLHRLGPGVHPGEAPRRREPASSRAVSTPTTSS